MAQKFRENLEEPALTLIPLPLSLGLPPGLHLPLQGRLSLPLGLLADCAPPLLHILLPLLELTDVADVGVSADRLT